ncbi:MAG: dephospho-CoA kinase [Candidatus Eisenbacteria bacterium]
MSDAQKPRRARPADELFIVGLVGRAGSGKSTVARALAAAGAPVLDADEIGHDVTDHDPDVRRALLAEYGPAVFLEDGTLHRRLVATKVFANPAALERLNALVHPRILKRMRLELARLAEAGQRGAVLVDAALMLDWGFERECDAVLAVVAPEEQQVARLVAGRGWTEAEARRRLAAQKPNAYFVSVADETLDNRGTEAELAEAARGALERLQAARVRVTG